MALLVGGAVRTINCEIGDGISGQLYRRNCDRIRDDLEANAFYLSDGPESVLLIGCDLLALEPAFVRDVSAAIEASAGVVAGHVIVCCTHTHAGPYTTDLLFDVPRNEAYLARLKAWLVEVAGEAVASARPGRVGWGLGRAHAGFNRRACWADGTHAMFGDPRKPEFTGIEGPDDPSHAVLFAVGEKDQVVAIAHNNCAHATCVAGANYASSDYPGAARAILRSALGAKVPVLYLQGASGDTGPDDILRPEHRVNGERRMVEMGSLLAGETLRLLHEADAHAAPALRQTREVLRMPVRLPTDEAVEKARAAVAAGADKSGRWDYVLQQSVLRLHAEFKDDPFDPVPIHAVRVGDFAIATNPCELFCQFGLDIRRRSPAKATAVVQLANGCAFYCPTTPAIMGGGYSGDAIYWCRLEALAGYKIVEATARLLHRLWK